MKKERKNEKINNCLHIKLINFQQKTFYCITLGGLTTDGPGTDQGWVL